MPWRRGIDSYNACYRKQMLALEALLEHCCSGVTASVILHLTARSKAVCTQLEAQVSGSEERPFLWSCRNYSKMTSQCRVNLINKIQGTTSMIQGHIQQYLLIWLAISGRTVSTQFS